MTGLENILALLKRKGLRSAVAKCKKCKKSAAKVKLNDLDIAIFYFEQLCYGQVQLKLLAGVVVLLDMEVVNYEHEHKNLP